jgi:hypothetical protein
LAAKVTVPGVVAVPAVPVKDSSQTSFGMTVATSWSIRVQAMSEAEDAGDGR